MKAATVTFTHLKDGSWGLRGPASMITAGASVTVTKKSGDFKTCTVGRVLWTGNGLAIATIDGQSSSGYARSSHSHHDYAPHGRRCDYCGSRECARAWNPHDLCDED